MDDKESEEIFARQNKQAEGTMKIVLAIFTVVMLVSLYLLMGD